MELELAKLLCGVTSTPVLNNKQSSLVFLAVCNGKFAALWVLCYEITCKWVFFPNRDVCFFWLAYISEINNRLITACIVKTATGVQCWCFTMEKA